MNRILIALAVASLGSGCVAQVRGTRVQKPYQAVPEGTRVSLVSVDVPIWLQDGGKQTEDREAILKGALLAELARTALIPVDDTSAKVIFPMGPNSKPIPAHTVPSSAVVGQAWPFTAVAIGAPPITFSVNNPPGGFSIDAKTGVVTWTPTSAGPIEIVLVAKNALGETKMPLRFDVVPPGGDPMKPTRPGGAFVDRNLAWSAAMPERPAGDAPLLMGAQLIAATPSIETMPGGMKRSLLELDVAYTIWTRGGRELETRRVRLKGVPNAPFYSRLELIPPRPSALKWDEDEHERGRFANLKDAALFTDTAAANAAGFLFTWGERKVWFSAQLDESDPALKPGLEASKNDDFEGAFNSWEQVTKSNPNLSGAFYNMGVMREVQGRDEEALALYKKALSLSDKGMYQRQHDALENRAKYRVVHTLP